MAAEGAEVTRQVKFSPLYGALVFRTYSGIALVGAGNIELTPDDLREVDSAFSKINVQGVDTHNACSGGRPLRCT
jgi:hypothetical protein